VEERPWAVSKGCQNGNRPWALGLSKGGWAVSNRRLEKASKIDSKQQPKITLLYAKFER